MIRCQWCDDGSPAVFQVACPCAGEAQRDVWHPVCPEHDTALLERGRVAGHCLCCGGDC